MQKIGRKVDSRILEYRVDSPLTDRVRLFVVLSAFGVYSQN